MTEAQLSITWDGQQGELTDPVDYETPDEGLRQVAEEAVRSGDVPGITADGNVDFQDFVVDRFAATEDKPVNRIFIRPKVPFGA